MRTWDSASHARAPRIVPAFSARAGSRADIYFVLIALYLLLLPVQFKTSTETRLAPSDGVLIVYLLISTASLRYLKARTWSVWHLGLLFAFCLSTLVAVLKHGEAGIYVLLNKDVGLLVLFAAYCAVSCEAVSWERIRSILKIFILGVGVTNIIALLSFFGFAPWLSYTILHLEYTGRLAGMLIDPNAYGGLLAVTFAVHAITYYSSKPVLGGVVGGIISITLATGILFTFSRSTWISVTFLLTIAMAMNWRRAGYLLCTIAVIVGIVWFVADVDALDEMAVMAKRPDQVEVRVEVLNRAMTLFLDNPVFGVGLGMFDEVARRTDRLSESYAVIIHNTCAWFLTEFGLVGFAMFVAYICWFWVTGLKAYKAAPVDEKPLVLGLVAAHTAMLGLSMGIDALYQRHWWLMMALIAASRNVSAPATFLYEMEPRDSGLVPVAQQWHAQGY